MTQRNFGIPNATSRLMSGAQPSDGSHSRAGQRDSNSSAEDREFAALFFALAVFGVVASFALSLCLFS